MKKAIVALARRLAVIMRSSALARLRGRSRRTRSSQRCR
jgi:hypothetical protein